MAKIEYRKEFFDRNYTVREAYRRVWKYARRYRLRLFVGIVCGMLTAGTLVPFFQIVQPALQHVESHDSAVGQPLPSAQGAPSAPAPAPEVKVDGAPSLTPRQHPSKRKNAFEKQIERSSRLPSWYPKVGISPLALVHGFQQRQLRTYPYLSVFCSGFLSAARAGVSNVERSFIRSARTRPCRSAPARRARAETPRPCGCFRCARRP